MRGLEIRSMYAIAIVNLALNPEQANEQLIDIYERAFALGWEECDQENGQPPVMFQDAPGLVDAWDGGWTRGREEREINGDICDSTYGTKAEWDALSDDAKSEEWEEFHELCAQGVADEMYFYRIMMNQHLDGYVGH